MAQNDISSYYDNGENAEKFREIDKFLELTDRFTKQNPFSRLVGSFVHKKPDAGKARVSMLLEKDGLDAVYEDLMHCTRIERSELYIGERYVFVQGRLMVRIKDIKKHYAAEEKNADDIAYFYRIEVSDEAGEETIDLRKLSVISVQRQQQVDMIDKLIGQN